jgi:hypothetical protein
VNIFQIKLSDSGAASPNTFQLMVVDGDLVAGPSHSRVVESGVTGRSFRLNVIHDAGANTATIFIDGKKKLTVDGLFGGKKGLEVYFKYGAYGRPSDKYDLPESMKACFGKPTFYQL